LVKTRILDFDLDLLDMPESVSFKVRFYCSPYVQVVLVNELGCDRFWSSGRLYKGRFSIPDVLGYGARNLNELLKALIAIQVPMVWTLLRLR
jgi:hypothetical protein